MEEQNNPFALEVVSVRLVRETPVLSEKPVNSAEDVVELLGEYMCELDREVICVVNFNTLGIPLNCHFASMGSLNTAIASPRELFKASILSNAANMILIHNHISGSLKPSSADKEITDRMTKLCELMNIPLLDHIIVGGDNSSYYSFKQEDIMPNRKKHAQKKEKIESRHFSKLLEEGWGR